MALQPITEDKVLKLHSSSTSKSKCFAEHTGLQVDKDRPSFSFLKVQQFLKDVFEEQTKLSLSPNLGNFYCLVDEEQQRQIEAWEKKQGGRVYIYSLLSGCTALGFNLRVEDGSLKTEKTEVGEWEYQAKYHENTDVISALVSLSAKTIQEITLLKEAEVICAVPSPQSKGFDLPQELATGIAAQLDKPNITEHFQFKATKKSAKTIDGPKGRWEAWKNAGAHYDTDGYNIQGKTVLLIDDKYQTGITLHYVAMKLQEAGAKKIYGLCMVKTRSSHGDTKQ